MTIFQALLLGVIQGLTEFLPVSSSGHLAIAQHYLPGFNQPGLLFDVLLHFGTMLAVVIYFRRELVRLALACFRTGPEAETDRRILLLLVLASVPTAIIGLSFKDFFEQSFHNLPLIAVMLCVTGTLLFLSERLRKPGRTEAGLTGADALLVGTVQGLAIIPGISRSGSTIATLLLKGVDGETAARFSFLLALPAVAGATLLQTRHLGTRCCKTSRRASARHRRRWRSPGC
jgi:undecaprenyl-diphosphatase